MDEDVSANTRVLTNHHKKLIALYGLRSTGRIPSMLNINLIDRRGNQGLLGLTWQRLFSSISSTRCNASGHHSASVAQKEEWQQIVDALSKDLSTLDRGAIDVNDFNIDNRTVKHIWFDYHHLCRAKDMHRLRDLYNSFRLLLDNDGMFLCKDNETMRCQSSFIRTNCIDCLDRTNVVQVRSCSLSLP